MASGRSSRRTPGRLGQSVARYEQYCYVFDDDLATPASNEEFVHDFHELATVHIVNVDIVTYPVRGSCQNWYVAHA